jgi:hypothetical protein
MQSFRWEIEGQITHPLEYAGNTYQMKLDGTNVQIYENENKILEEDISDKALEVHRDQGKTLQEQLLDWGRVVLETFIQRCGVCENEKMAFPLALTQVPHEEAAFCKSKGIEMVCPDCVNALGRQNRERSIQLKQAFLRGEVRIFGGTDEELLEVLQSSTGYLIQQFSTVVYPGWKLGAIRFSDQRLYLALIQVNNEEIQTFVVLAENSAGQITSLHPDMGLEALGFQESDEIQFLTFG